jgi:hypothetical protein
MAFFKKRNQSNIQAELEALRAENARLKADGEAKWAEWESKKTAKYVAECLV